MAITDAMYLDAACALTEGEGGFDRYQLAREVERRNGLDEYAANSRAAGAWLRRRARRGQGLRKVLAPTHGRGAEAAGWVVVELLLRDWRKAQG